MAVAVSDFYAAFPEFSAYKFQDPAIQFWLDLAGTFVNQAVWGPPAPAAVSPAPQTFTPYDYGVMFYAAHNIAIALQSVGSVGPSTTPNGAATGAPGLTVGNTQSKTVDKVSISYDIASIVEEGAGHWNKTSYGQRFARMAKQFGAAPQYVGAGFPGDTPLAWGGPGFPFPGWWAW